MCVAWIDCPKCAERVELWAETEEWEEDEQGVWRHAGFGGGMGVCDECHVLIAEQPDGRIYWHDLGSNQTKEGNPT